MLNFELLTKKDIEGDNCLEIFKKISFKAEPTDLVADICSWNKKDYIPYWLNSYRYNYTCVTPFKLHCHSKAEIASEMFVHSSLTNEKNIGIRLKVNFDDIKAEIATCDDKIYFEDENGVKVVLALEYPQTYLSNDDPIKKELDLLYNYKKLRSNKEISIPGFQKPFEVYSYGLNGYIKIKDNWAKIEPIEWYYDEINGVLVSKKVFLGGIPLFNLDGTFTRITSRDFSKTKVADYVNGIFVNQSHMEYYEKDTYSEIPFSSHSPVSYFDELDEIMKLEEHRIAREKRHEYLIELKKLILEVKTVEELMNKMDVIEETLKHLK